MATEEDKIIEAIKRGGKEESKAILAVMQNNKARIYSFVKRHGGSTVEAEDILMEGVTELVFNVRKGKYKGTGSIGAYLSQICRLLWYQKYRTGKIDKNQESITEFHLSDTAMIDMKDTDNTLDKVLNQIGSACKQILTMWSQSYNMTEIQVEMDYGSPQVAMNKKSKCIKKLKTLVDRHPNLKTLLRDL